MKRLAAVALGASFLFSSISLWAGMAGTTDYVSRCNGVLAPYGAAMNEYGDVVVDGVKYWRSNRTLEMLRKEVYLKGEMSEERLRGRRVLEVPCGAGAAISSLNAEHIPATGVDILFDPAIPRPSYLVQGNWTALPFESGSFDTVILNNGIFLYSEHYSDAELEASLREAKRVAAHPGEVLVAGVAEPERLERIATAMGLVQKDKYPNNDSYTTEDSRWTYRFEKP